MASIGFATLQIIPSLKGVTEAIEKEVAGKTVKVTVDPSVDQRAAQKAGKEAGDAVAKEANAAVRKGNIGKTVHDEIKSSAKSSPAKEAAKAIVDGIADGVKKELPGGRVSKALIDGIADGVKQGIDGSGIGGQVVDTIGSGIRSGNLGGTLKDALIPEIKNIGREIQSSAASWAGDIGNALRSGDIQGATDQIGKTVQETTDLISDIGSTFGLQLDGVREFGNQSATTLTTFGNNIQNVVNTATGINSTFNEAATLLETVLPAKAGAGAAGIARALGAVAVPAWLLYLVAQDRSGRQWGNGDPVSAIPNTSDFTPGQRSSNEILYGPYIGPWLDRTLGVTPPGMPNNPDNGPAPGSQRQRRGAPPIPGLFGPNGYSVGGYTGSMSANRIAGVVHGGEYVINARATAGIQNAMPGLLSYLNNKGALPGYAQGGLVAGAEQLRSIIAQRFGISNIGGWRPADKYGEHATGRALDVMTSSKAIGDAVKNFAVANASAIDLKWAIWQQKMWYPDGTSKAMPDRGSPTQNHMDHVHIFSGPGITNGLRSALAGGQEAKPNTSMLAMPDPTGTSAPDQTGMIGSAIAPDTTAGTSGTSINLASSFSGLAGTGLDKLSPKTKVSPDSPERTFDIGGAAASAIGGQVGSLLSVGGVNDSPGWLQGLAGIANAVTVNKGSAAPMAASIPAAASSAASAIGSVQAGTGALPGPQVVYNIQTTDLEPAYLVSQRHEKERVAAEFSRF